MYRSLTATRGIWRRSSRRWPKRRRIADENVEETEEVDETDTESRSENEFLNEDGCDIEEEQRGPALPGNSSETEDWEEDEDHVLAKQYHDTENDYDKTKALQGNRKRLYWAARDLAEASGITGRRQARYGEKHAKAVQDYFEGTYPGKYRLMVFSRNRGRTPVYNGGVNADMSLCIYHEDDHFHAVKTPQKLFGCRYYCVACETSFHRPSDHTIKCSIKCSQCLRMGCGFPCQGDETSTVWNATRPSKLGTASTSISG